LLTIRSPLAGTVVRIDARSGDTVDLNRVLAQVVDLNRLVVAATVRSADVARLKVGQAVEIWTGQVAGAAYPEGVPTYPSDVVFIASEVDPETGTVRIRTKVPRDAGLLPGQFVNIRIAAEEHRDRLAVPIESVVTAGGRSEIAVVEGNRAHRVEVKTGIEDGAVVEIEGAGLEEGMTVVTDGVYGLADESELQVIDP
jgi:membrane fusion protein (multidrug efflux system)